MAILTGGRAEVGPSVTTEAGAAFSALTDQQRAWLIVIYQQDRSTPQWTLPGTRGQWAEPATMGRWLDYGVVAGGEPNPRQGELQRALREAKAWDCNADEIMTVLAERHLIRTRSVPLGRASQVWVAITATGRAAARAGAVDNAASPRCLPETFWLMLTEAYRAGATGLIRDYVGAWHHLANWDPALVAIGSEQPKALLQITPAGTAYYREHWQQYTLLYPSVRATSPGPAEKPTRSDEVGKA